MTTIKSDGGASSYYDLPEWCKTAGDIIRYKKMSYEIANIFKASFRYGEKDGAEKEYDLRKIIYFAQKELEYLSNNR